MLCQKFDAIFHVFTKNSTQVFRRGFLRRTFSKKKFVTNWKFPMQFGHIWHKLSTQFDRHSSREECLEAISNWNSLQEVEVIRPYLIEGDSTPYPLDSRHWICTLRGKGSPNQHIYYFKSQTGNVVAAVAIMTHLFIGTLKEVAFENGSWSFLLALSRFGSILRNSSCAIL